MNDQTFIRRMRGMWGRANQHGKDVVIAANWPVLVRVSEAEIAEHEWPELSKLVSDRIEAELRRMVGDTIKELDDEHAKLDGERAPEVVAEPEGDGGGHHGGRLYDSDPDGQADPAGN